ncbi:hypothetical protein I7V28_13370 [Lelliottia amnigena]|uniref:hypothetical protein n=1 Tax=Lelliottia amnigena TaxID=61646 RepID=UPI00192B9FAA|nr:hypothetical protein [Lelliottia amnigena]MBL5922080.1 hypothetical protein [Lelliottia amnigena]
MRGTVKSKILNITVEDLTSTSSKGPETTGRSKLFERTGGSNAANKEFDALSPSEIKEIPSGRAVNYPMGERLSYVSVILMVAQLWRSNQERIGSNLGMTSNHICLKN